MKTISEMKEMLQAGKLDSTLAEIYVDENLIPYNRNRYIALLDRFASFFPEEEKVELYSAPGRSEVCGNHTDHQNGMVLATSINLDAVAVAAPVNNGIIRLVSDDFPMETVSLNDLERNPEEEGTTTSLIRGVAAGLKEKGYQIGGFVACVTSDVLMGAGMSSSAAFESLIGTILSGLYNNMSVPAVEIAKIGQFAENVYFGKPCGLMDQMACSVGGMIYIDFADKEKVVVEKVQSDFKAEKLNLCIVDTKGSHADLTPDYAAIPAEMKSVAKAMGKEHLREVEEASFYAQLSDVLQKTSGRSVLRAIHFYEEEKRVQKASDSLRAGDYESFLQTIRESGNSSAKFLQNIYSPKDVASQNVTVALAVSESILGNQGVCRVHGGGFAGTIQVFVKDCAVDRYQTEIEKIFGEGSCHVLQVRNAGGICVLK